ncbi:MAG: hypothetical protein KGD64_14870, partial [Candidatus Heimdallarchaeota archaeon]|nr:hypothetical protein [Candidatus Heimdallarchaeota archaeon]
MGKTNTIINIYEEFSEYPAIFYSGTVLGQSFFDELKFDFNLEFSPNETELTLLKKISSLAEDRSKPFIIFIDALDEWIAQDRTKQLDNLTKVLIRYGIKLCVSCKDIVWNSFLVQREIPTLFSQHLFVVPPLTNFNDSEFAQASKKYSRKFKLKVNYKNLSSELYNPFSLRISCEVARTKNIAIESTQNSRETLNTFITQKLSKTGELQKLQRYLNSISQILLAQDAVQIEENQIRNALKLYINEELPIEVFSSNLLYRNIGLESQDVYIGFYFSKIRDHIISTDVLALSNKNSKMRIAAISDSLHTYVGENAINYFFRTGTQREQEDCITAFIEFDKANSESKLTKIIAQQEGSVIANLSPSSIKDILDHTTYLISDIKDDRIISREITTVLRLISMSHDVGSFLVDLLITLNNNKENGYDISPEICRILQNYDRPELTKKLKNILLNRQIDNRIRRFVIDALDNKELEDRISVFNSLLDEAINGDGEDVSFYAEYWYSSIENATLRNRLLKLFDESTNGHVLRLLADTLAYSKLEDTGMLLLSRFQNETYSDYITCWLCRAICSQNYRPAIPKFIELLKEDPTSSLADHILIGLGEMQAKETMPALFEIINNLDEKVDAWWLSSSFSDIAEAADYEELNELYSKSVNPHTKFFIALTLAKTRIR